MSTAKMNACAKSRPTLAAAAVGGYARLKRNTNAIPSPTRLPMKRLRNIILVAAWAGLIWMILETARDQPVSETFWINLAYIAGLIAVALILVVTVFPPLMIRLRANISMMIAIAVIMLFALAAVDIFWLRDIFRAGN
jgi:uncharacterized membrane protein YedE/YeeE